MKPGKILAALTILFVVIVIYFNKCNNSDSPKSSASNPSKSPGISVNGVVVKSSSVTETIHVTGSLLSNKEVEIRNEITGRLIKIYFQEGTKVNQGDLLVKIYDLDLQAQLKKLKLDLQLTKINESRAADLLKVEGISKQEYEQALNTFQRVEADISLLEIQISKTEIRAPFSGIVGLENVNEGSLLSMNTKIVSLQELNPMKLEFSIPERYKAMIRKGQELHFTLDSDPQEYSAAIYAYEPKIDPLTRSLSIRARCDNKDGSLSPGAFAKIELPLSSIDDALMIPSEAIIPELKGYKLFVQSGGKASPRKVEIGMRNDSTVQIISGIAAGDTVLTNGIMQLRPEMPVFVRLK